MTLKIILLKLFSKTVYKKTNYVIKMTKVYYQHLRNDMVGDGAVPEILVYESITASFRHSSSTACKGETFKLWH